ncbi:MAG: hypothetical protein QOD42_2968 [Sphingomonadales bacterium]|jgi:hypothetical protein|nr:hypothetical protein [Sphingomonadales bacterium]
MGKYLAAVAAMAVLVLGAGPGSAQPPAWSPGPWLDDLAQARAAIETRYANLEWLLTERELDLDALFARARAALGNARSDGEAVAIFNRLVQRIGDGHVGIEWPRPAAAPAAAAPPAVPPPAPTAAGFCRARGYASPSNAAGLAPALSGYAPLGTADPLPAGTIPAAGGRAGILRIAVFDPHGSPELCADAVAALAIPLDRPCDEACDNRIVTHAYRQLGIAMQDRLARLREAGARTLIVDITGNGGGSEWTEAAARMLSRRPLQSARLGFVRGPHWERLWRELAGRLRAAAGGAGAADRARLLGWAGEADAARAEAQRRCPPTGDPACPWLGRAGFATGLVGRAPSGGFAGRDWAVHVFNPAQHSYVDGAWDGPVIVLTDQETWSAAEQFAALLQDNRAALILGARTGGAGCGHTWGGTPTRLTNSGATLALPDCVRFRADGSNEVRGIIPDQLLPWRANDGRAFRARLLEAALPAAIDAAAALYRRSVSR